MAGMWCKPDRRVLSIALALGGAVWFFDALADALVFSRAPFLDLLVLDVPGPDLFVRSLFIVLFLGFGWVASCLVRAHRETGEKLAYQALILNRVSDAVIATDLSSDQPIQSWNRGAEEIYGWTAEEAEGRPLHELLNTEVPSGSLADVRERFREDGRWEGEVVQRRKDGALLRIWVRTVALEETSGHSRSVLGVHRDITARTLAQEAMEDSALGLRALTGRLAAEWEEERLALSRELHDDLGHDLIAHLQDLHRIEEVLDSEEGDPLPLLKAAIRSSRSMAEETRDLSAKLRSPLLELLGLKAALEGEIQELERSTSLKIVLDAEEVHLAGSAKLSAFRVVQEALENVRAHAEATELRVSLREEDGQAVVRIADNGKGISRTLVSTRDSVGLLEMKERARSAGGTLEIRSEEGRGTEIFLAIPLPSKPEPDSPNHP